MSSSVRASSTFFRIRPVTIGPTIGLFRMWGLFFAERFFSSDCQCASLASFMLLTFHRVLIYDVAYFGSHNSAMPRCAKRSIRSGKCLARLKLASKAPRRPSMSRHGRGRTGWPERPASRPQLTSPSSRRRASPNPINPSRTLCGQRYGRRAKLTAAPRPARRSLLRRASPTPRSSHARRAAGRSTSKRLHGTSSSVPKEPPSQASAGLRVAPGGRDEAAAEEAAVVADAAEP